MKWFDYNNKYFHVNINKFNTKQMLFFKKGHKKIYKRFNFNKNYRLVNFNTLNYHNFLLYNVLFLFLLKKFNNYKLITWSISRVFLINYLNTLFLYNLYFNNYLVKYNIYSFFSIISKKLFSTFYLKLLALYSSCFLRKNIFNKSISLNQVYQDINLYKFFNKSSWVLNNIKDFYIIYLKVSLNNVFLTLTKNGKDVLISLSGGQTNSKKKKNTLTIFFLLGRIMNYLDKNNIKLIHFLIIRAAWYRLSNTLLAPLKKRGIRVQYVGYDFIRSHNGLRKRKLRRL